MGDLKKDYKQNCALHLLRSSSHEELCQLLTEFRGHLGEFSESCSRICTESVTPVTHLWFPLLHFVIISLFWESASDTFKVNKEMPSDTQRILQVSGCLLGSDIRTPHSVSFLKPLRAVV